MQIIGLCDTIFFIESSQPPKHALVTQVFCTDVKLQSVDKVKNPPHNIPLKTDQEEAVVT
jgi:hypothetical protein